MAAATHDLSVEQGSTLQFQMEFVKDGTALDLTNYTFRGEVKASIYDEAGFVFRFERLAATSIMVYLDAPVSSQFDFDEGVYDIVMTSTLDNRVFRLIQGKVTIAFGVTL